MPPEELALEVLKEKSSFVVRQKSTQELERGLPARCRSSARVRGPVEALLGHPKKACRRSVVKHRGVVRRAGESG